MAPARPRDKHVPIPCLVEGRRHAVLITTGEIISKSFGGSDWRQQFRDWILVLVHRKLLDALDATYLLFLSTLAQQNGSLRGQLPDGRFHDEEWLAARLGIDVRTFSRRWNRWMSVGIVDTTGRPNRGRVERWLVPGGPDTSEINSVRSSRDDTVEINPVRSYKEVDSGGSSRVRDRVPRSKREKDGRLQKSPRPGLRPTSDREFGEWQKQAGDPVDCLRLGLDMLALGIPVQIFKPSGTIIEATRYNPSPLVRMLGDNNPELAIAARISDRPSLAVLKGDEGPRVSARHLRTTPTRTADQPLLRVLAALEDHGFRPVRKGNKWQSKCPAHEHSKPDALQLVEKPDLKVNLKCFKGCDWRLILGILDLSPRDLYPSVSDRREAAS